MNASITHTHQRTLSLQSNLIVDNFAGGGGASTGIELALGRPVDIAVNHCPEALGMHAINHPDAHHYIEDVFTVDPRKACNGLPVLLAHFSPDCKHHSRAKGGKPLDKKIRGLAWVAVRWAALKKPRVITLENVKEFADWGPLDKQGRPIASQKGRTFNSWRNALQRHGYRVEWRPLCAHDYGAPTSRERLFLVARRDDQPIVWPEPTHGPGCALPYTTAADCIDWSIPTKSIFERTKPLAEKSQQRLIKGVIKFVINNPDRFIVPDHAAEPMRAAFITDTANGSSQRNMSINEPLRTITAETKGGTFALVTATLTPLITAEKMPGAANQVYAYIMKYFGTNLGHAITEPLQTLTAKQRFALVTVHCHDFAITDIGLRMLAPHELYRAQGFSGDYIHTHQITPSGEIKPLNITDQVRMVGNSVSPLPMAALIRANLPDHCQQIQQKRAAA